MDSLSLDDLRELTRPAEGHCVSLYMPTVRAGPGTRQNPLRLKNLLKRAEDALREEEGLRGPEATRALAPAEELLEHPLFWRHLGDGLAVFLRHGWFRALRLPLVLPEEMIVGRRFHVTPLLPLLTDGRFLVLALSQHEIRLLEGTRHGVTEMRLKGVPAGLADALRYEETEKERLFHIAGRGGSPGARAVFHGHGIGEELEKDRILRYFHTVDRGLREVLRDERAPMVLAGVEYLLPIYREASTYPHLLEEAITGNPETLRAEELRDRAWSIVEPRVLARRDAALARYAELAGAGPATADLETILAAAEHGRVETLFVAAGEQRWGAVNPDTGEVKVHEEREHGDEELLDLATVRTLLSGGTAHVLPAGLVPEGRPAAAVFRF